jgi:hypothetical protein
MTIRHAFVTAIADGGAAGTVQPSHWNSPHVIDVLTVDPVSPISGDVWILATGTTPDRHIDWKFCDTDGIVVTLLSVIR